MRVLTKDKLLMGDAVTLCLEYARYNVVDFLMGPFDQEQLLKSGLVLEGDIEDLVESLKLHLPELEFVE